MTKKKAKVTLRTTIVVTITGGKIVRGLDTLVTYTKGPVQWIVVNLDAAQYDLEIDVGKIKHTSNGNAKEHPFPGKIKAIFVDAKGGDPNPADQMERIKSYKPAANPDIYKYTLELKDKNSGRIVDTYDPDLDVIDPNSILQM